MKHKPVGRLARRQDWRPHVQPYGVKASASISTSMSGSIN